MAKYRWGFLIQETPYITRFEECYPYVNNETALQYSKEANEQFYRAKLNSNLDFRFEYDYIIGAGYEAVHIVVLESYNESTAEYEEIWRGRFTLTDCTVNVDTRTITVTPDTIDNYTEVMAHIQDEYNMIKLKPKVQPIDILIRPCLQLYSINDSKLTNYIGESYWEADCNQIGSRTDLTDTYHFSKIAEMFAFYVYFKYWHNNESYDIKVVASGDPTTWEWMDWGGTQRRIFYATGNIVDSDLIGNIVFPVSYVIYDNGDLAFSAWRPTDQPDYLNDTIFRAEIAADEIGLPMTIYFTPDTWRYDANAQLNYIYARCILQTELAQITLLDTTLDTYDIPTNDIAGNINFNYNKVCPITTACVHFDASSIVQAEPTQWGQSYYQDRYFVRFTQPGYNPLPVGISEWKYASLWVYPYYRYRNYIDDYSATRTIKDAFPLASVIRQLFAKADNSIQFEFNSDYSRFFFDAAFPIVANPFRLYVTPRSNIISSYYDSPAQNAPITLLQVLEMLKSAFKVYWYIDKEKKLHFEHLNYFENGLSYDEANTVLIDLDSVRHTRTLNSKAFGQNTYKYDKQDMPDQYQFLWDDTQTLPFVGVPMKALDPYVSQGMKNELNMSKFDADIDYILSTPDDIAKDGFALIACRYNEGEPTFETEITKEITIQDEDGIVVDYLVQNADCAMAKRETDMWRYGLPCEHWLINNLDDTAKTTGNFKLQTIEFADLTMNDIITDVTNCIKKIRTQQGDGMIKTLSINLNSFSSKADLLFNFIGRKFYLRGTALNGSMIITINGEQVTIEVEGNKFTYGYTEPLTELSFANADVVSVNFSDTDKLDSLTSVDEMFMGCAEMVAVDFANKTFGAVTSALNMFAGAVSLQTLICPATHSWKPDIDFSDCPNLTAESLNDLIVNFLYSYESGDHTITPNATMWNALSADVQSDLMTKAQAKGWQIGIPAQYALSGTSGGGTVYVTINGTAMEINVVGGAWEYAYNIPITSISFENDTDVVDIDFSLSDGLAGVTSLNDAFKGCVGLTTVDFSNCDLSNLSSATDAFAGCTALYELIIPSGTWQPDIDLSSAVMPKTEMLNVINGLYTYTSGTHTITFNSTIWNAMSVADQQIVFDAAYAKGWQTNAVAVIYVIRGTSNAATETFNVQFIDDEALTPSAAEQIVVNVDGGGNWQFSYNGKKLYSMTYFCNTTNAANTSLLTIDFTDADDMNAVTTMNSAFWRCSNLNSIIFGNGQQINNCIDINRCFAQCTSLTDNSIIWGGVTFAAVTTAHNRANINEFGLFTACTGLINVSLPFAWNNLQYASNMFRGCSNLVSVAFPNATFQNVLETRLMFYGCSKLENIYLSDKTFASLTNATSMFYGCSRLSALNLNSATFASLTYANEMFMNCSSLTSIDLSNKTFAALVNATDMFTNCSSATTIDMTAATFGSLTTTPSMFQGCVALTSIIWPSANLSTIRTVTGGSGGSAKGMFLGCRSLVTIPLNNIDWNELTNIGQMFNGCYVWNGYDFSNVAFSKLQRMDGAFASCRSVQSFNFSSASFSELTRIDSAFYDCQNLTSIIWSNNLDLTKLQYINYSHGSAQGKGLFEGCTLLTSFTAWSGQSLPNVENIGWWFYGCTNLTTIDIPLFLANKVDDSNGAFFNCDALTTINVPTNSTAILPTSTPANAPIYLGSAPLTYQSMLKVANWLSDLSGQTAHTCTFWASAWNALTQTEKDNIDAILFSKNWTRAIAQ